jgi:uncharacterized protein (UPF0335 family)
MLNAETTIDKQVFQYVLHKEMKKKKDKFERREREPVLMLYESTTEQNISH